MWSVRNLWKTAICKYSVEISVQQLKSLRILSLTVSQLLVYVPPPQRNRAFLFSLLALPNFFHCCLCKLKNILSVLRGCVCVSVHECAHMHFCVFVYLSIDEHSQKRTLFAAVAFREALLRRANQLLQKCSACLEAVRQCTNAK